MWTGSVDPLRDVETIETELLLADIDSVTSAWNASRNRSRATGN